MTSQAHFSVIFTMDNVIVFTNKFAVFVNFVVFLKLINKKSSNRVLNYTLSTNYWEI